MNQASAARKQSIVPRRLSRLRSEINSPDLSPWLFALPSTRVSSDQIANLLSECRIIKWRNVSCRAEQGDKPLYPSALF
jgi:hypothetical protein